MSAVEKPPPVVYASRAALADAARLGIKRPIENLAVEAIEYGRIRTSRGDTATFHLPGFIAYAKKTRSNLAARTAFVLIRVDRRPR